MRRLFGRRGEPRSTTLETTVDRPFRIAEPKLGLVNMLGAEGASLLRVDRAALARHFVLCIESSGEPLPACDVLFLYCTITPEGRLGVTHRPLRELIMEARAYVTVVASANPGDHYMKADVGDARWKANVVMTMDRCGEKFPRFFARLFEMMKRGVTMPVAWNELAPQIPGYEHEDAPATVVMMAAGHVTLG